MPKAGALLWVERFDRDAGDFSRCRTITSRIAVALNLELLAAAAMRPTEHADALDYILRGRAVYLRVPARDGHVEAIDFFERALALDPSSRGADPAGNGTHRPRARRSYKVRRGRPRQSARVHWSALAASPRDPLAHYAKGLLLRARHRYDDAVPEYEAAIAFNRNWASAYADLGWCKFSARPWSRRDSSWNEPSTSVLAIRRSAIGRARSGLRILCSPASMTRSSASKRRELPLPNCLGFTFASPLPTVSEAKPRAPPRKSQKPSGWNIMVTI